ncbi:hypothetical protein XELAEV_18000383mg [Xenopus laevis]|uniref:Large ribosomal subunit protein mL40 n=1 Tax=Xenopus laevis TaxID=8355 RepID=A0A974BQF4_XENLA|nr:hypothetical protein XELAEV_18000383mg [Xenopus laevis]
MNSAACGSLLQVCRQGSRSCPPWIWRRESHWQTSLLTLRLSMPMSETPPQLIPIEDFIKPAKFLDETRVRTPPQITPKEQERRALLMKTWALSKQKEHEEENRGLESLLEAQEEALRELRLESEELYNAAILADPGLLPLEQGSPTF